MRVLHVNTERSWRGGERQTLLTLRGLNARSVWAGLVAQPESPLIKAASAEGIPVFPLRMRGSFNPVAAIRLAKLVRREWIGLLHLQTAHAANIALLSRFLSRRTRAVVSRRVDFPVTNAWKYNRFDAIAAISTAIKEILVKCGVLQDKIRVIPSGVPLEVEKPTNLAALRREIAGEAPVLIGTIGHLAEHKGHRYLVEALPRALKREPGLRLAIIGDGECRAALEKLAQETGVAEHVVFTGFRPDALDLLWALDLLAVPSVEEGLCTTLFDAMLREVPIVATTAGGIPEALDNGRYGALVPPGDPAALADRIIEVLRDDSAKRKMKEGASDWVRKRFSVDSMVEKTLDLYRELSS